VSQGLQAHGHDLHGGGAGTRTIVDGETRGEECVLDGDNSHIKGEKMKREREGGKNLKRFSNLVQPSKKNPRFKRGGT
jgi:hypothetical protein